MNTAPAPVIPTQERIEAAAEELLQRIKRLGTDQALPGDSAMRWLDNREECLDIIAELSIGLHFMETPA
jgi:hypothetical protein